MKLHLEVEWHKGGCEVRYLSAVIERPYGREPMIGESIVFEEMDGEMGVVVEGIEWYPNECRISLKPLHEQSGETYLLDYLLRLGFKEE